MEKTINTRCRKTTSKAVRSLITAFRKGSILTRTQIEKQMFRANNGKNAVWAPAPGYGHSMVDSLVRQGFISRTRVPNGAKWTYVYSPGPNCRTWIKNNR